LYPDWRRRLLALPALLALGTGVAWSNANAVLDGLFARKGEFKRTPKYAATRRDNKYALRINRHIIWEIALAAYALWGSLLASRLAPTFMPCLSICLCACGAAGFWGRRYCLARRRADS